MDLEFASIDEIYKIQSDLLTAQVDKVYKKCKLMKEKFKNWGIDPADIKGIDDLNKLPFTTKQELHGWGWDMLAVPSTDITEVVSTSGTTGGLFYFPLTTRDLDLLAYGEKMVFSAAGIGKEDKCQITVTLDNLFMAGMAYYLGMQSIGAMVYRVGPGNIERQLEVANTLGTTVMVGVPSFLIKLLKLGRFPALRKIILVGESILTPDLTFNALGERLKTLTQAELFSSHGITEIGCSFSECLAHNGLHARPGHIIAEVVDTEGNSVAEGDIGELVVTTLQLEAMPVIRYKTGDLVVKLPETPCACGRNGMRIGPVVARRDQTIKLKGTTVYPSQIQQILFSWPEIVNFQIIVYSSHDGVDNVLLKIGTLIDEKVILIELQKAFRSKMRVVPNLEVCTPEEVERSLQVGGSRKARVFYDCRIKVG